MPFNICCAAFPRVRCSPVYSSIDCANSESVTAGGPPRSPIATTALTGVPRVMERMPISANTLSRRTPSTTPTRLTRRIFRICRPRYTYFMPRGRVRLFRSHLHALHVEGSMELSGRSVVLTGVGREGQVGEAVARAFAERGARVYLVDRMENEARARSDALNAAGLRSAALSADLSDPAAVD